MQLGDQPAEVVYVIGPPGSNTVKIGRTVNLEKRFADLRTMSPVPLEVLWSHPGGSELESNLHRHFRALRTHGEWFSFAGDPVPAIRTAVEAQPWVTEAALRREAMAARRAAGSTRSGELASSLQAALVEIDAIENPVQRFKEARAFRAAVAESERSLMRVQKEAILALKKQGLSWREVGERLDMSGARAEQIAKGRKFR